MAATHLNTDSCLLAAAAVAAANAVQLKSMFADARQPWGDAGYSAGVRQTIYK